MGKKLSTFIGDSTYARAPPNYRSPLRSNYHLSITSEKSVRVKESVVRCADHGVTISHYHADNGKLKDKAIVDKAATSQEYVLTTTITYTEKMTKCHYHLPVALCTESSI
jgi:hypothetical protein